MGDIAFGLKGKTTGRRVWDRFFARPPAGPVRAAA
jgi:hypothetical protein